MATLCLDQPVTAVPGISDNRARILGKLGIRTVRDLLTHFPRRYLDLSSVESISSASIGQQCTVAGTIYELTLKTPKPRLNLVEITLIDDTGTLIVTCFRQPWLMDKLSRGMYVAVSGEVQFNYGMKRMTNPFIEPVGEGGPRGKVVPIHGATEKLSAAAIRSLVQKALGLVRGVEDFLPLPLRQRYRLMSRGSALEAIHFPSSMAEQHEARRRLAYEEVLLLQLHLMRQRADELQGVSPVAHKVDGPALGSYYGALPFTLSDDQLQAVSELLNVMAEPSVASHMLLGDVGTGKTVVAGFGGYMVAPIYMVRNTLGTLQLRAFAGVVIGGFGSIKGAIIGSLIVGMVEVFSTMFLSSYRDVTVFLLLLVFLLFRPQGWFGEKIGDKA